MYGFRPFRRSDLARASRWLSTPEVVRWWGEPTAQLALLAEDLAVPAMRQWVVSHAGRPFAYVQDYPVHAWPQPHLAGLPEGTRAVDAFVGEPAMLGRGHGAGFLRAFAERLLAEGAPLVAIDPDPENLRARRAYARAGFVGEAVVEAGDGAAVLMLFRG